MNGPLAAGSHGGDRVATWLRSRVRCASIAGHPVRAWLAQGASWEHVVKWTCYVAGLDEAKLGEFFAGIEQATEHGLVPTAATLVGVQALYLPELLVEIEAIAEI